MYSPELYEPETTRDIIQEFGGYNHNVRIGENEFYDMKNLSSENYPTLSPRRKRGKVKELENCNGLHAKNELAYVSGNELYYGDEKVLDLDESKEGERSLVSMGAYFIVYPDMMYYNTANGSSGKMYNDVQTFNGNMKFQLCNEDGSEIDFESLLLDFDSLGYKERLFLAKDKEKIYVDPFSTEKMYLDGILNFDVIGEEDIGVFESFSCVFTPLGWALQDNKKVINLSSDAQGCYFQSYWKLDNYLTDDEKAAYEKAYKEYGTGTHNLNFGNITINYEIAGKSIERIYNVESKLEVETDEYGHLVHWFQNAKWEPIKKGFLRLKEQNGESVIQICTNLYEGLTPNKIWNTPSCWSDYPTYVKISAADDIRTAAEKIKEAKTSDKITMTTDNILLSSLSKKYAVDNTDSFLKDIVLTSDELNTILIPGCLDFITETEAEATISFNPVIKPLDHIFESNNRLWGCRYGEGNNGGFVNEIYATAQGSFKQWEVFDGTSKDSYAVSLGSDGEFTAAIEYRGRPLFFKENCYHMVYGAYPSAYQLVTETGTGVKKGSHKSLCIIQNILYYHAPDGIYRFDGSSYEKISAALGFESYSDAVAGSIDNKYYVAMTSENGTRELFVYDIGKGTWHKEDAVNVKFFAKYGNDLYFATDDCLYTIKGTRGTPEDKEIEWYAESGVIGYSTPDAKYVDKLQIRLSLPLGSSVSLYISYDSDEYWQFIGNVEGNSFRAFTLPILPRRCDHFKIRVAGVGECKIFSLSKVLENGGDV